MIPNGNNIARLCGGSTAPNGVPQAGAFRPNLGSDDRPPDDGLSVYWLELLKQEGSLQEKLQALREFCANSPVGERKAGKTAVWAVIPTEKLNGAVHELSGTAFQCLHMPRNHPDLANAQDPHSEIHTNPPIPDWNKDSAWRLAVQQFICDQVVHHESATIA
ncbi:hypothetical protein PFX98_09545 [Paucibacter sediminis]|uniref:Uncharacterized protein n=1 Tax=Paucibacter sediminis TaxID=3019553 RepID=A0AA95NM53_9BURK|nr:hypothetical protein [Paucibacter sp. S2-9]WIT13846.1 hypothetical protein PFX98_09545 [Paucibacter sp. S2-9]